MTEGDIATLIFFASCLIALIAVMKSLDTTEPEPRRTVFFHNLLGVCHLV